MTLALLVALTTCAAVWFLTGHPQRRGIGAVLGLIDSILWLLAGVNAGKVIIALIAAFCALCFARPFVSAYLGARLRRHHAN